jgi:hypothetical protein
MLVMMTTLLGQITVIPPPAVQVNSTVLVVVLLQPSTAVKVKVRVPTQPLVVSLLETERVALPHCPVAVTPLVTVLSVGAEPEPQPT